MKHRALTVLFLCVSIAVAGIAAQAQHKRRPVKAAPAVAGSIFRSITSHEISLLLSDIAATNPKVLERLASDIEFRHKQLDSLKELLAVASQAEKDGLALGPTNKQELENIRSEIIATAYDRELNQGKTGVPAFASISAKRVADFWAIKAYDAEFERFLQAKLAILKANDPNAQARTITGDERSQARDVFAKVRITSDDYETAKRKGLLGRGFIDRVNFKIKLQQAQFLAGAYLRVNGKKFSATESDIAAYFATHPEISPVKKRAAAQQILERAKSGEDFAVLADRYSDDPGNIGKGGTRNGGAYVDVPLGMMVRPFENAALALKPGEIAPQLVESDFGYHIIKLDRKGVADGKTTYDVRHILISTTVPDPSNPNGRPLPLRQYVTREVESEKQDKWIDTLVVANKINVPQDFVVPAPNAAGVPPAKPEGSH
jgi:parvulin-like peptidyl-prolyl isomerase